MTIASFIGSQCTRYALYRRESNGEVKARLHALWHLCRGKREVEVAELVGVAARTVRRWVSWYRSGGLPSVRRYERGKAGRTPKLNSEQQALLQEHVQEHPAKTAHEMRAWVEQEWTITYHPKAWYVTVHRLGLRTNVPRPRSDEASDEAQEAWKKKT